MIFKDPEKALNRLSREALNWEDGRHGFEFELLLDTLQRLDLELDMDALYDAGRERISRADRRRRAHYVGPLAYVFRVRKTDEEMDAHFDLIMTREAHDARPHWICERGDDDYYEYLCYGRDRAAELLRYVRMVHAGEVEASTRREQKN